MDKRFRGHGRTMQLKQHTKSNIRQKATSGIGETICGIRGIAKIAEKHQIDFDAGIYPKDEQSRYIMNFEK